MIELSDSFRTRLERRARVVAPLEACGLISAPFSWSEAERNEHGLYALWSAENAASEPEHSFLIAPEDQKLIIDRVWNQREDVVAVFHSHPHSGPEPSALDHEIAKTLPTGLTWVIVGLCTACGGSGDADTYAEADYPACASCHGSGNGFWIGELS